MKRMGLPAVASVRPVEIVGVASGIGAADPGTAAAPDALRAAGLEARLRALELEVAWRETLRTGESEPVAAVRALGERLAAAVGAIAARGSLPLVIGGDHSCAIGTWKGLARSLAPLGPIGLVWIDAHMDAHTPATSETGALHGMPLACLLGHGAPELTRLLGGVRLHPEHVCLIGVRSYERGEAQLLESLGVKVFFMDEVERRGLHAVMESALAIARAGTAGFGVSIDIDAIDPEQAPAVNTPAPHGLHVADLCNALASLACDPRLVGLEVVEYTPALDGDGMTAERLAALVGAVLGGSAEELEAAGLVGMEYRWGAHNYDPLPVVLERGRGVYAWDTRGRRFLDMLSAYSAVSHGHCHPRLVRALARQARRLTLTSRVFHNEHLPRLQKRLCELTGQDAALPANTGLEAVEVAIKAARKWAYTVKHVPEGQAEIIVCEANFHGRSIAIVAFSSEDQYRAGFGPFPPGFRRIPFGDADALERAITPNTAAFLVEPIQGEGGINVPPEGYLARCREICTRANVLLVCDEVQTGLGRTGRFLACEHEGVRPDGLILGKALGGGMLPVSAFLARRDVMEVFAPGDHGSTFGGNPLAAAVALEALDILIEDRLAERAEELGAWFLGELRKLRSPLVREVRGRGLLIGIEVDTSRVSARAACRKLLEHGILTKDTHGTVVRFAPPLVVKRAHLQQALGAIRRAFRELEEAAHAR